ncbi:5'-methylthioadenosine nucleosidase-like isoform X3 [Hibiscus syriacus]|uniref:5'-methylthioadenosine nucleosidase-like isoform X3 n=1 Tax=Hibiscus syriacus TaxID=106335 RepID=UPI0019226EF5|nr:5'-methylthioadenosine nucleosidase-like isoform X3 [Hibiscus syriacus]
MAPHGEGAPLDPTVAQVGRQPISSILIVIAMQTEALPVVNKLKLVENPHSPFPEGVPWVHYHGTYKDIVIHLVWPGKDLSLGVDNIGTVSASLVTYASIQALQHDLIINAGTAGGFKVFDLYGVGSRQTFPTPNLLKTLNLKSGKLSTGDSLDMTPQDETSITANDATVKDMEGAALAYVADLLKVPVIFVKAVTDIVDGDKPAAEEFLQNLVAVTAALDEAVDQIVNFITGKCLFEL